jgi:hypothetical protein
MRYLIGSLLLLPFLWVTPALACSCRPEGPIAQEYQDYDYIFKGTVVRKLRKDLNNLDRSERFTDYEYVLRVSKTYKGQIDRRVIVYSGIDSAMCGLNLTSGKPYLVWVRENPNGGRGFEVSICTRTRAVSDAQEDLEWLEDNT